MKGRRRFGETIMNMQLKCFAMLLLVGAVSQASAAPTGGKIMFAQDVDPNGNTVGQTCSIEIEKNGDPKSTDYNFRRKDIDICNNDVHSFFRVDNAPSAVLFTLSPDGEYPPAPECKPDPRWHFTLRTFRQKTTTGWISIESLRNTVDKEIVDIGGVRMEEKDSGSGNIRGKLSCVTITY
jgi:hypothetical protein